MSKMLSLARVAEDLKIDRNALGHIVDATEIQTVDVGNARGFTTDAIEAVKPFVNAWKRRRGVTSDSN